MGYFGYIISGILALMTDTMMLMFFIRMVMSWISPEPIGKLGFFIFTCTEFVVAPIRELLNRFRFFAESPLDFSFIAAALLLFIVRSFL
ncbi:MAG: YggT family protein [Clostridia bacterium]|nr:YggT family protein [Clostridia bacterium]